MGWWVAVTLVGLGVCLPIVATLLAIAFVRARYKFSVQLARIGWGCVHDIRVRYGETTVNIDQLGVRIKPLWGARANPAAPLVTVFLSRLHGSFAFPLPATANAAALSVDSNELSPSRAPAQGSPLAPRTDNLPVEPSASQAPASLPTVAPRSGRKLERFLPLFFWLSRHVQLSISDVHVEFVSPVGSRVSVRMEHRARLFASCPTARSLTATVEIPPVIAQLLSPTDALAASVCAGLSAASTIHPNADKGIIEIRDVSVDIHPLTIHSDFLTLSNLQSPFPPRRRSAVVQQQQPTSSNEKSTHLSLLRLLNRAWLRLPHAISFSLSQGVNYSVSLGPGHDASMRIGVIRAAYHRLQDGLDLSLELGSVRGRFGDTLSRLSLAHTKAECAILFDEPPTHCPPNVLSTLNNVALGLSIDAVHISSGDEASQWLALISQSVKVIQQREPAEETQSPLAADALPPAVPTVVTESPPSLDAEHSSLRIASAPLSLLNVSSQVFLRISDAAITAYKADATPLITSAIRHVGVRLSTRRGVPSADLSFVLKGAAAVTCPFRNPPSPSSAPTPSCSSDDNGMSDENEDKNKSNNNKSDTSDSRDRRKQHTGDDSSSSDNNDTLSARTHSSVIFELGIARKASRLKRHFDQLRRAKHDPITARSHNSADEHESNNTDDVEEESDSDAPEQPVGTHVWGRCAEVNRLHVRLEVPLTRASRQGHALIEMDGAKIELSRSLCDFLAFALHLAAQAHGDRVSTASTPKTTTTTAAATTTLSSSSSSPSVITTTTTATKPVRHVGRSGAHSKNNSSSRRRGVPPSQSSVATLVPSLVEAPSIDTHELYLGAFKPTVHYTCSRATVFVAEDWWSHDKLALCASATNLTLTFDAASALARIGVEGNGVRCATLNAAMLKSSSVVFDNVLDNPEARWLDIGPFSYSQERGKAKNLAMERFDVSWAVPFHVNCTEMAMSVSEFVVKLRNELLPIARGGADITGGATAMGFGASDLAQATSVTAVEDTCLSRRQARRKFMRQHYRQRSSQSNIAFDGELSNGASALDVSGPIGGRTVNTTTTTTATTTTATLAATTAVSASSTSVSSSDSERDYGDLDAALLSSSGTALPKHPSVAPTYEPFMLRRAFRRMSNSAALGVAATAVSATAADSTTFTSTTTTTTTPTTATTTNTSTTTTGGSGFGAAVVGSGASSTSAPLSSPAKRLARRRSGNDGDVEECGDDGDERDDDFSDDEDDAKNEGIIRGGTVDVDGVYSEYGPVLDGVEVARVVTNEPLSSGASGAAGAGVAEESMSAAALAAEKIINVTLGTFVLRIKPAPTVDLHWENQDVSATVNLAMTTARTPVRVTVRLSNLTINDSHVADCRDATIRMTQADVLEEPKSKFFADNQGARYVNGGFVNETQAPYRGTQCDDNTGTASNTNYNNLNNNADRRKGMGPTGRGSFFLDDDEEGEDIISDTNETFRGPVCCDGPSFAPVDGSKITWVYDLDQLRVVFEHKFDFAAAMEELVNAFKAVKKIHNIPSKVIQEKQKLWANVRVRCRRGEWEVGDAPFEVALSENYELGLDEQRERELREEVLQQRLAQIRERAGHLHLTEEKLREMFDELHRQNARVLHMRHQQTRALRPKRTHLMLTILENVDLAFMSDIDLCGLSACVARLKEIDHVSPYPDDGLEFDTLWGRKIVWTADRVTMQLRDHPKPLVETTQVSIHGTLMGAEAEAAPHAVRYNSVFAGDHRPPIVVGRKMPPLKFYYDIFGDTDALEIGWGPAYDYPLADVSAASDFMTKVTVDPSPALPWWDKMRLNLHGRLVLKSEQMWYHNLASRNPYNCDDMLDFGCSRFSFDWTPGLFDLRSSSFDVYVRAASKLNEVHFLHMPNLHVSWGVIFYCKGDKDNHHVVMPYAPDKIPCAVADHDSFRVFRSESLAYELAFTVHETEETLVERNVPFMTLHSRVLPWLSRWWGASFIDYTLPIRRGTLWQGFKSPTKLTLGRHFSRSSFYFFFPQLELRYWHTPTNRTGAVAHAGRTIVILDYDITYLQQRPELISRASAEWDLERCCVESVNLSGVLHHGNTQTPSDLVYCSLITYMLNAADPRAHSGAGGGAAVGGRSGSASDGTTSPSSSTYRMHRRAASFGSTSGVSPVTTPVLPHRQSFTTPNLANVNGLSSSSITAVSSNPLLFESSGSGVFSGVENIMGHDSESATSSFTPLSPRILRATPSSVQVRHLTTGVPGSDNSFEPTTPLGALGSSGGSAGSGSSLLQSLPPPPPPPPPPPISVTRGYSQRSDSTASFLSTVEDRASRPYSHQVSIKGLHLTWTLENRKTIFWLIQRYKEAEWMTNDLAADALSGTVLRSSAGGGVAETGVYMDPTDMLRRLVNEAQSKFLVHTDDETAPPQEKKTARNLMTSSGDDVVENRVMIEVIDGQIKILGEETPGVAIMQIERMCFKMHTHSPYMRLTDPVVKKSWLGSFLHMRIFISAEVDDNLWLPFAERQRTNATSSGGTATTTATATASSTSVATMVGGTGASTSNVPLAPATSKKGKTKRKPTAANASSTTLNSNSLGSGPGGGSGGGGAKAGGGGNLNEALSMVMADTSCEFSYVFFDDEDVTEAQASEAQARQDRQRAQSGQMDSGSFAVEEDGLAGDTVQKMIDTFAINFPQCSIAANADEYQIAMDIVSNVLLYSEPGAKESSDRLDTIRYTLELTNIEDDREPITQLQNRVRLLVKRIRQIEYVMGEECRYREAESVASGLGVSSSSTQYAQRRRNDEDGRGGDDYDDDSLFGYGSSDGAGDDGGVEEMVHTAVPAHPSNVMSWFGRRQRHDAMGGDKLMVDGGGRGGGRGSDGSGGGGGVGGGRFRDGSSTQDTSGVQVSERRGGRSSGGVGRRAGVGVGVGISGARARGTVDTAATTTTTTTTAAAAAAAAAAASSGGVSGGAGGRSKVSYSQMLLGNEQAAQYYPRPSLELERAKSALAVARRDLHFVVKVFKEKLRRQRLINAPRLARPLNVVEIGLDRVDWMLRDGHKADIARANLVGVDFSTAANHDDSSETRLEVSDMKVVNLLPDSKYTDTLGVFNPTGKHIAFDRNLMLRIFTRYKAPVGGIPVVSHFEVNLVPVKIQFTARLYEVFLEYFFPKEPESKKANAAAAASAAAAAAATAAAAAAAAAAASNSSNSAMASSKAITLYDLPSSRRSRHAFTGGSSGSGSGNGSAAGSANYRHVPNLRGTASPMMSSRQGHDGGSSDGGGGGRFRLRRASIGELSLQGLRDGDTFTSPPLETSMLSLDTRALQRLRDQTSSTGSDPGDEDGRRGKSEMTTAESAAAAKKKKRVAEGSDHVSLMKARASKNLAFIYVKIPALQICVSYKGEKDYNIEDYHNFVVKLGMLEYHNRTLTWLDLLMQIKADSQTAIVAQAIKEKLRIRRGDDLDGTNEEPRAPSDRLKATLLFGKKMTTQVKASLKRGGTLVSKVLPRGITDGGGGEGVGGGGGAPAGAVGMSGGAGGATAAAAVAAAAAATGSGDGDVKDGEGGVEGASKVDGDGDASMGRVLYRDNPSVSLADIIKTAAANSASNSNPGTATASATHSSASSPALNRKK